MMQRVYLDNSATSFPKPPGVTEAMADFAANCGASAGRGAYAEAKQCEQIIADCRRRVAELINAESPERIVFTLNCSEALAIVIRGLLNTAPAGTHAIATAMEHNSVLGLIDPDDIRKAIRRETRLVVCVHVSNVTGTMQPIEEITRIAREAGVPCLIDAAQSAGHVEIDVQALDADFVAFPGHKGLGGPLGTGVLYIRPGMENKLPTMKEGGTGTISEQPYQPRTMPDKYEIGSHNAIGLAGLAEGVGWVLARGVADIRAHDLGLCRLFLEATEGVRHLKVYGPRELDRRAGVFSVNVDGIDPQALAATLEANFGICTRAGVHCAPLANKTIGTYPAGTCRMSFGPFTTEDDVRYAGKSLAKIAERAAVKS